MKNAIEITGLRKKYEKGFELGSLQFSVMSGTIAGLIGENGAGKTTLLKILLGISHADEGEIRILGKDFKAHEAEIKEEIGVVLDDMFFSEVLTPDDIGKTMADIFHSWDDKLFEGYLEEFDLPAKKPMKTFSKGMRKKLEIAAALSHRPKLLILDEPTNGLDPVVRNEILDIFQAFVSDEEHTILLSTHITTDLEHIADQIIFLDRGKKVMDESRDEIMDEYGILRCDKDFLNKLDDGDIIRYQIHPYSCEVLVRGRKRMQMRYPECVVDRITLENLMMLMTKGEKRGK